MNGHPWTAVQSITVSDRTKSSELCWLRAGRTTAQKSYRIVLWGPSQTIRPIYT